ERAAVFALLDNLKTTTAGPRPVMALSTRNARDTQDVTANVAIGGARRHPGHRTQAEGGVWAAIVPDCRKGCPVCAFAQRAAAPARTTWGASSARPQQEGHQFVE